MRKCEMRKAENNFVKWYFVAVMSIALMIGAGYYIYKLGYDDGYAAAKERGTIEYERLNLEAKELSYAYKELIKEMKNVCRIAKERNHDCADYLNKM